MFPTLANQRPSEVESTLCVVARNGQGGTRGRSRARDVMGQGRRGGRSQELRVRREACDSRAWERGRKGRGRVTPWVSVGWDE